MQQQGGFTISCIDADCTKQVAEAAKVFLKDQNVDSWADEVFTLGDSVKVDYECFIDFDVFDGLFEKLCKHIEEECPGCIVSGDARYANLSTDYTWELSMSRTESGINVSSEAVDWDAVFSMLDDGMDIEEVASIFDVDPSVIERKLGSGEDDAFDEDDN